MGQALEAAFHIYMVPTTRVMGGDEVKERAKKSPANDTKKRIPALRVVPKEDPPRVREERMNDFKTVLEGYVKVRKGNRLEWINQRTRQTDASIEQYAGRHYATAGGESAPFASSGEAQAFIAKQLQGRY